MSDSFPIAFGRYQLVERLAIGGMAELFKARMVGAHGFQKYVVIKKILPHLSADSSFVAMLIDEANITVRLAHPKIVQVLDLGRVDEELYIAMEFVDGMDVLAVLRACAKKKQALPPPLAAYIAHEVLDALDCAHRAEDESGHLLGIVHRDISPSNVLISRRGNVKLADFGIAHAVERQQKTQAGTLKGKYGYMSPEQVVGKALDGRSDIFSVGILLAEMLMGRRLFTAPNDLDVLLMVRDVRLERLEKYAGEMDPRLREILLKALQREPKNRFASADEFGEALAAWLHESKRRVRPADLATFVISVHGGIVTKPPVGRVEAGRPAKPEAARAPAHAPAMDAPPMLRDASGTSPDIPIVVDLETEGAPKAGDAKNGPAATAVKEMDSSAELDFAQMVADADAKAASVPVPPSLSLHQVANAPGGVAGASFAELNITERCDEEGDFAKTPPIRTLYRLASDRATGLLVVEVSAVTKGIFFVNGVPEFVSSNMAHELLGEYLVAQKVITPGELAMALAMMPHFGGKLGDTLVGLGLLKPLDVFRHLMRQVREKIVDVCTWQQGKYKWYRGKRNPREAFPLGLDAYEVIGAGATAIPKDAIESWSRSLLARLPVAAKNQHVAPEAFRLGAYPRDVYNRLDGRLSLREHMDRFTKVDDCLAFLRTLFLFVNTDLAYFS